MKLIKKLIQDETQEMSELQKSVSLLCEQLFVVFNKVSECDGIQMNLKNQSSNDK